jgi:hypothetical protein
VARSLGGSFGMHNLTLLCLRCNVEQDTDLWPWLWPLSAEPDFLEIIGAIDQCEMTGGKDRTSYVKSLIRLQPTIDSAQFAWLFEWKGYDKDRMMNEMTGAADWRAVVAELADDDDLDVVCANGCPEGALGRHKFSCPLAIATRRPTEEPTEGSTS